MWRSLVYLIVRLWLAHLTGIPPARPDSYILLS
jgi:hypothetical protein